MQKRQYYILITAAQNPSKRPDSPQPRFRRDAAIFHSRLTQHREKEIVGMVCEDRDLMPLPLEKYRERAKLPLSTAGNQVID
jgi:hypothetical protein